MKAESVIGVVFTFAVVVGFGFIIRTSQNKSDPVTKQTPSLTERELERINSEATKAKAESDYAEFEKRTQHLKEKAKHESERKPITEEKKPQELADLNKVEGKWRVVSWESFGKEESPGHLWWEFYARRVAIRIPAYRDLPEKTTNWNVDVDEGRIDIKPDGAPNSPAGFIGIYKLEGDTLVVCFKPGREKRPTVFASRGEGSGEFLVKFVR